MGSVFGKETVLEPSFKIISDRTSVSTTYQIREYGKRFAAETDYSDDDTNQNSPFRSLATYIGVFGEPQNEGKESLAMTAPVAMERKGTTIAMTAPVAMEKEVSGGKGKTMKFFLPKEYDELKKIPKPTNSNVRIIEVPPSVGVAHRYSGSLSDQLRDQKASQLSAQLRSDGIERMTEEHVLQNYQFWGYNPPFTLPIFRRNEIWLDLTEDEVSILEEKFKDGEQ